MFAPEDVTPTSKIDTEIPMATLATEYLLPCKNCVDTVNGHLKAQKASGITLAISLSTGLNEAHFLPTSLTHSHMHTRFPSKEVINELCLTEEVLKWGGQLSLQGGIVTVPPGPGITVPVKPVSNESHVPRAPSVLSDASSHLLSSGRPLSPSPTSHRRQTGPPH